MRAREGIAPLALERCGCPAAADLLGVQPPAVCRAAQRGSAGRERWEGPWLDAKRVR